MGLETALNCILYQAIENVVHCTILRGSGLVRSGLNISKVYWDSKVSEPDQNVYIVSYVSKIIMKPTNKTHMRWS